MFTTGAVNVIVYLWGHVEPFNLSIQEYLSWGLVWPADRVARGHGSIVEALTWRCLPRGRPMLLYTFGVTSGGLRLHAKSSHLTCQPKSGCHGD